MALDLAAFQFCSHLCIYLTTKVIENMKLTINFFSDLYLANSLLNQITYHNFLLFSYKIISIICLLVKSIILEVEIVISKGIIYQYYNFVVKNLNLNWYSLKIVVISSSFNQWFDGFEVEKIKNISIISILSFCYVNPARIQINRARINDLYP